MHKLSGDRDAVLEMMRQTVFQLGGDTAPLAKSGMKAAKATSAPKWAAQRDEVVGQLKRALDRERDKADEGVTTALSPKSGGAMAAKGRAKKSGPVMPSESVAKKIYMPRDRTVAVFQAAMDEYLDERLGAAKPKAGKKARKSTDKSPQAKSVAPIGDETQADLTHFFETPKSTGDANLQKSGALRPKSPFEQYGNLDPRWASVVVEKLKSMIGGKAKFVAHKTVNDSDFIFKLPQQATIALVSDWGGGNESARSVAAQIKARQPNFVIHLGDIYYAGTDHEVRTRFLDLWDFNSSALKQTFALNGNHEMYSGGHAYFKMLKKLGQPASYFRLGNEHWRLIGLDTAYVDHDLNKEQVQWLDAQLKNSSGAKNVLLSHHQPFSAFERASAGETLRERVRQFTDAGSIHGWMWGHEHLCVVYDKHLGMKGRCVGHGCIPYDLPRDPPASSEVKVLWWNKRKQPPPLGGGTQGFAMLTIDGPRMDIEYIDEDGTVAKREENFQNDATVLK